MSQFAKIFESIKETPAEENKLASKISKTKTNARAEGKPEKQLAQAKKKTVNAAQKPTDETREQLVPVIEANMIASPVEQKPQTTGALPALINSAKKTGKSSNQDYTQVLTYIRRDTHKLIKKALIDDPLNRDLSDLVEELLTEWIKKSE